mmetsp:Transcript_29344/g.62421  ORF Transcript_29344/g.62421 Transcript_29344/m.62421 type:complete len:217 (+) Transcript_29344:722-1372(+)
MMPGKRLLPRASTMYPTMASTPPAFMISFARSGVCRAISRMRVAAFFRTNSSVSLRQFNMRGKISASTTTSARSTECLAICDRQEQTCLFRGTSPLESSAARSVTAPASTTTWARSGECLQMSANEDAAIRFSGKSGSWKQRTRSGTAPASTTVWARSLVCLATYPKAQDAASFTEGSNSSRHRVKASIAPESTTACANCGECLATARNTKAAAFL